MVWIPGRTFLMGSDRHYPDEAPAHRVAVDGFWMDHTPVTNADFRKFARATGHVTVAELAPDPAPYPEALPEMLHPGSLVFVSPPAPVDMRDSRNWWQFVPGANWRHPSGPNSSIQDRGDHPVVHIAYQDAVTYARWAGKSLPTEAEWEMAARGGIEAADYAWGAELMPDGRPMANFWQGEFPWQNSRTHGYEGTSPVRAFPPNGYGVLDMIGNVWEWTTDWYTTWHPAEQAKACCIPRHPRGREARDRRVTKGGSHLCSPNYSMRCRPAARFPEPVDTSTCHLGFRCVVRPESAGR
jgi:formylglycine-generating enzyme required for sulfatase activity